MMPAFCSSQQLPFRLASGPLPARLAFFHVQDQQIQEFFPGDYESIAMTKIILEKIDIEGGDFFGG